MLTLRDRRKCQHFHWQARFATAPTGFVQTSGCRFMSARLILRIFGQRLKRDAAIANYTGTLNEISASLASSVLLSLQCAFAGFHFSDYPGDFLFICPGFGLAPTIISRPFVCTCFAPLVPPYFMLIHTNHILSNIDFLTDSPIKYSTKFRNCQFLLRNLQRHSVKITCCQQDRRKCQHASPVGAV